MMRQQRFVILAAIAIITAQTMLVSQQHVRMISTTLKENMRNMAPAVALQRFRNRIGETLSTNAWSSQGGNSSEYNSPLLYDFEHAFDAVPDAIMNPSEVAMYLSESVLFNALGGTVGHQQQQQQQQQLLIYFIMPTYKRDTQMVDLTRLGQTLMHDHGIYWIVIEDSVNCTRRVRNLLDRTGLMYAHVSEISPKADSNKHRGVNQRNRGLAIVEALKMPGIVYFGDDDNAYDIRLFPELRRTKKVSVFSVGFTGRGIYERCVVNATTGRVSHFATNWATGRGAGRKFKVDMAGFACHSNIVLDRIPRFRSDCPPGYLETNFLEQLVTAVADLEPLNDNCTKTYVWHVKTDISPSSSVLADRDGEEIEKLIRA